MRPEEPAAPEAKRQKLEQVLHTPAPALAPALALAHAPDHAACSLHARCVPTEHACAVQPKAADAALESTTSGGFPPAPAAAAAAGGGGGGGDGYDPEETPQTAAAPVPAASAMPEDPNAMPGVGPSVEQW